MRTFMDPVLDALNDGSVIRKGVKTLVLLSGFFLALATLLSVIVVLKLSFAAPSALATVGGLLLCLFIVIAAFCGLQVFVYRARSIDELGPSPFTVVPIVAILFRLVGEVWAISCTALAIGGCLAAWLGGPVGTLVGILQPRSFGGAMGGSFLMGIALLGVGIAYGAIMLLGSYFMAELIVVTVDMARSLRTLVQASGGGASGGRATARPTSGPARSAPPSGYAAPRPASPAHVAPAPPSIPRPTPPAPAAPAAGAPCPSCGVPAEPDSAFCAECGTRF